MHPLPPEQSQQVTIQLLLKALHLSGPSKRLNSHHWITICHDAAAAIPVALCWTRFDLQVVPELVRKAKYGADILPSLKKGEQQSKVSVPAAVYQV